MATANTVSSPRIDRKFVDANGNLTQNAYALLYGLIVRTGGTVAPIIDMDGMEGRLASLEVAPGPVDHAEQIASLLSMLETLPSTVDAQPPAPELHDTQAMQIASELDALRKRIEALEIGTPS